MYLVSLQGQATSASPSASGWPTECSAGTKSAFSSVMRSRTVAPHASHDPHARRHVGRVGQLDAEHRPLRLEVTHDERDHVHRAALHAALVEATHEGLHLLGVHPVVGGPRILLVERADVGAVLDPRDIDRVGGGVEGVRLDVGVEAGERAGRHEGVGELGPLLVGPGAPVDAGGLAQLGDLGDEVDDALVGGGEVVRRRVGSPGGFLGGRHCLVPLACCQPEIGRSSRGVGQSHGVIAPAISRGYSRPSGAHIGSFNASIGGPGRSDSAGLAASGYPRAVLRQRYLGRGRAPVAQRIEHLTTDQKVWGSNPYGRADRIHRMTCANAFPRVAPHLGERPFSVSTTGPNTLSGLVVASGRFRTRTPAASPRNQAASPRVPPSL